MLNEFFKLVVFVVDCMDIWVFILIIRILCFPKENINSTASFLADDGS